MLGHFRILSKQQTKSSPSASKRKKSLTVTISKEPPVIHKFERDNLEYTFECVFDPFVRHDDESEHPDLLFHDGKKRLCKPWEMPPYADEPSSVSKVLKRLSNLNLKSMHKSTSTSNDCQVPPAVSPV